MTDVCQTVSMGSIKATIRTRGISGDYYPIVIRIIHERKAKELKVKHYKVSKGEWDDKRGFVKLNNPRSTIINSVIKRELRRYEDVHDNLAALGKPFSLDDIITQVAVTTNNTKGTFSGYLKEYIDLNPDELSEGTLTYYRTTYKRWLEIFPDKRITEITENDIIQIRKHLISKGNNTNTVYKLLKTIRKMLHKARREKIIGINPFQDVQLKQEQGNREFLSKEEISLVKSVSCSNEQSLSKDVFLFSCYTGLRFGDICLLKKEHIKRTQGGFRLQMVMGKTRELLSFKLNNYAIGLIQKYEEGQNELIFPLLTEKDTSSTIVQTKKIGSKNAYLNKLLKQVIKEAGISKNISMHCGRHTFAVLSLEMGGDIYVLSKMLGHSSISTTELYAKVVDKRKDELTELWNI